MDKVVYEPLQSVAFSKAVVIEHDGYQRVHISGTVAFDEDRTVVAKGDLAGQTRHVLELIEGLLAEFDGDMTDIVRVRVYMPELTDEGLRTVHEVRHEFFEHEHKPASTLVEVGGLVDDDLLIEIDAEAVIPDDGWSVTVVEGR